MKKFTTLFITLLLALGTLTACGTSTNGTVKVIDIELTQEQYAFGVDKTQPELLEQANEFIAQIKSDGTLEEICEKYFSGGEPAGITSAALDDSKEQLVIATNAAFEPFEYIDGDTYYGIDMEIAQLFADYLDMELVIQNMDFDAVCLAVGQQKADIAMAGLTITEDRKEHVSFTDSYYDASQTLVVLSDCTEFDDCTTVTDVEKILYSKDASCRIGVQNGTTGQFYSEGDEDWGFTGLPVTTVGYKNGSLAVQDLINGNIDYVIIDSAPAVCIVEEINKTGGFDQKIDTFINIFINQNGYSRVLEGLKNTALIAVSGLIIGVLIGTLIATIRVVPKYRTLPKILNGFCDFYVSLFRGTPIVVQLLIFYYVLFPILGIRMTGVEVSILVFGLNSGAYVSETMRSGIQSVDSGQMEAGRAMGLSFGTTMIKIVIPQAVKNILPTLGNEFISLIKETSVVSFVGATDLYVAFNYIGTNSYEFMVPYIVMALIYIVLVLIISAGIKLMERSLKKSDKRN